MRTFSVIWHAVFLNRNFTFNRYFCANSKYKSFSKKSICWKLLNFEFIYSLFNAEENPNFNYYAYFLHVI